MERGWNGRLGQTVQSHAAAANHTDFENVRVCVTEGESALGRLKINACATFNPVLSQKSLAVVCLLIKSFIIAVIFYVLDSTTVLIIVPENTMWKSVAIVCIAILGLVLTVVTLKWAFQSKRQVCHDAFDYPINFKIFPGLMSENLLQSSPIQRQKRRYP